MVAIAKAKRLTTAIRDVPFFFFAIHLFHHLTFDEELTLGNQDVFEG